MNSYTLILNTLTTEGTQAQLSLLNMRKAALLFRAVNNKLRLQIIKLIDEKGQMTVTEIYQHLLLEQSVASQQLSILRKAGFVKASRKGKFIYYSINANRFAELNKITEELLK